MVREVEVGSPVESVPLPNDDPDWWVRAGVAHVLHYVDEREVQRKAAGLIANFKKEQSIFARNRMLEAFAGMGRRGQNDEEIVAALLEELEDPHGFYSGTAASTLLKIGPGAYSPNESARSKKRVSRSEPTSS